MPEEAAKWVYACNFFVLENKESKKQRAVFAPSTLLKAAQASLAKARLKDSPMRQFFVDSGQLGQSKGGTEIAAHLNHVSMAYGQMHISVLPTKATIKFMQ